MNLYELLSQPLTTLLGDAGAQAPRTGDDDEPDPYTTLTRMIETADEERATMLIMGQCY